MDSATSSSLPIDASHLRSWKFPVLNSRAADPGDFSHSVLACIKLRSPEQRPQQFWQLILLVVPKGKHQNGVVRVTKGPFPKAVIDGHKRGLLQGPEDLWNAIIQYELVRSKIAQSLDGRPFSQRLQYKTGFELVIQYKLAHWAAFMGPAVRFTRAVLAKIGRAHV